MYYYGGIVISKENQINEEIRASEVRLIDENGEMRGIMSIDDAMALADEANLDLVNISPNAEPPVCKILDYGKYRYELQKKEKQNKKNQKVTEVKEIRLSPSIEDHDVQVKAKTAIKFLKDGDKLKVSLRFRGRERDYVAKGYEVMEAFAELVSEYGVIEKKPKMEGRRMNMFLAPKRDK
ncbi:MAG: translation initiation factor IF-3 [Anaerovoracaceae bacterium]